MSEYTRRSNEIRPLLQAVLDNHPIHPTELAKDLKVHPVTMDGWYQGKAAPRNLEDHNRHVAYLKDCLDEDDLRKLQNLQIRSAPYFREAPTPPAPAPVKRTIKLPDFVYGGAIGAGLMLVVMGVYLPLG